MKKLVSLLMALVLVFAMSSVAMADVTNVNDFATLKAKLEAGESVRLTSDITTDVDEASHGYRAAITITGNVTVSLDLNGFSITGTDKTTANYALIHVCRGAVLNVYDNSTTKTGAITVTAENYDGDWARMSDVFEVRGGTLNLYGGTFEHLGGTGMAYAVNVNANSYGDATLNVYDGVKLDSTYTAVRLFMDSPSSNSGSGTAYVNVYGGEIAGDTSGIWAQAPSSNNGQTGIVNVSGGEVGAINMARSAKADTQLSITDGTVGAIKAEASEVSISGGTVTGDLTLYEADCSTIATEADVITGGSFTSGQDITGFIVGNPEIKEDYKGGIHVGEEAIENMPTPPAVKRYEVGVVEAENGDVTVKGSASYDSGVVITAAPHYGYEVGTVTVTKADGTKVDVTERADGTYSFSMPRGEVTIKVTFVPQGEAVKMVLTIGSKAVDVNGKAVASDVAPVIKASRTFLPVRLIAENLGAKVEWNNDAQTVTITKGDTVIVLTVGSTTVLVNGQPAELEAPVFIENSRTYLPVRFIAEKLGADVEWNGATNEVTITGRK